MARKSRLPKEKVEALMRCFANDCNAKEVAKVARVNHKTAVHTYRQLRELIERNIGSSEVFSGKVEIDHAYIGSLLKRSGPNAHRAWSSNKLIVFGIYDRSLNNGTVYAVIVPDTRASTLLPIIKRKVKKGSYVYSDACRSYAKLKGEGYKLRTVNHSAGEFKNKKTNACTSHIDSFWGRVKWRYKQMNGIPKKNFSSFLQECVLKFNHREFKDSERQNNFGILSPLKEMIAKEAGEPAPELVSLRLKFLRLLKEELTSPRQRSIRANRNASSNFARVLGSIGVSRSCTAL